MAATDATPPAIELEHAIGYAAGFSTSACLPNGDDFVYATGCCVVLSKLSDPHDQQFLRAHDDDVRLLRVSKSGKLLVTSQNGTNADVIVWDLEQRVVLHRFTEHEGGVAAVALSADERLLLTVGNEADRRVFVWDLSNGGVVATLRLSQFNQGEEVADCCWGGRVRDVKRRETGEYQFCILCSTRVLRWRLDPHTGNFTSQRTETGNVVRRWTCASYSNEGDLLFVGSETGDLSIFTTLDGVMGYTQKVSTAGVRYVCVAPSHDAAAPAADQRGGGFQYARFGDGAARTSRLYIGGGAGGVAAYRIADHQRLRLDELGRVDLDGPAASLSLISPGTNTESGELLVGTGAGNLRRVRPFGSDQGILRVSDAPLGAVNCIEFHGLRSDLFATGSSEGVVRVWDLSTYEETVRGAVGTGGGRRAKGTLDAPTVQEQGRFGGQGGNVGGRDKGVGGAGVAEPLCMTYLGQTDVIISGWSDGAVRCFDAISGELHWSLPTAHRGPVTQITHASTVKFFVTAGEFGEIKVWDIRTRELIKELKEHTARVSSLHLFPDNCHLLSSSRDRNVLTWDLRSGKRVAANTLAMGQITGAVLCPNQTNVISAGTDRKVTLWDLRQTEPVRQVQYASKYSDAIVNTIAGDHRGKFFATGGTDQVVKLWDQSSLAEVQAGIGHSKQVSCVRFAPDDKQILSCGADRSILVWNLYS